MKRSRKRYLPSVLIVFLSTNLVSVLGADPTPVTTEFKKFTAPDGTRGDWFGFSVDIAQDLIVVGSRSDDDACPTDPACESGSAYIFGKDKGGIGNWGLIKKITASDAAGGDWFGEELAIDGDTLVVGASGKNGIGADSGAAYVFERNLGGSDNWGQSKIITPADADTQQRFGSIVSLSGNTVVVSAPGDDDACPLDANCNSGAAYVYYRDHGGAENWGQVKKLVASDAEWQDIFGGCSIDGDILLIGSAWDDDACPLDSGCNSGSAYVFYRNQGGLDNWGEVKKLTASNATAGDLFGRDGGAVVSGNTAVVGALFGDGIEADSGLAYVFERNLGGTDNWGEVTELKASNGKAGDWFSEGVMIRNDLITIGARVGDGAVTDSGAAYLYQRDQGGTNAWGEVYILNHTASQQNDYFGADVSSYGALVVVGARQNGNGVGAAYLFNVPDVPDVPDVIFKDSFEDIAP